MKCKRCGERVSNDMAERVAETFDVWGNDIYSRPICWDCAVELFNEREQNQAMMDSCQDEGD